MSKDSVMKFFIFPALAPALLFVLYLTPKDVFGCRNRGLMALTVVLIAFVAALVTAAKGLGEKRRGNHEQANLWLASTMILLFSLFLLAGPLR